MRIQFIAKQIGFSDEDALVFGIYGLDEAGAEHYLLLQRDRFDSEQDWGVHLEYDDQSNGDYNLADLCFFTSSFLSIDLNVEAAKLRKITGVEARFSLDDNRFQSHAAHLRAIFRGTQGKLRIG